MSELSNASSASYRIFLIVYVQASVQASPGTDVRLSYSSPYNVHYISYRNTLPALTVIRDLAEHSDVDLLS